jgi:hypothetical protein
MGDEAEAVAVGVGMSADVSVTFVVDVVVGTDGVALPTVVVRVDVPGVSVAVAEALVVEVGDGVDVG